MSDGDAAPQKDEKPKRRSWAGIPAVLLVPPGAPRPHGCATTGSLRTLADDLLKETLAS